jgi:hypothetical protein
VNSEFRRVGYIAVSGSGKSLKILVDQKVIGFVSLSDIQKLLRSPKLVVAIVMPVDKEPS